MVPLQICDRKNQGTNTETVDPHQDDHPPAFTLTHDDRVPRSKIREFYHFRKYFYFSPDGLVDVYISVNRQKDYRNNYL